LGGSEVGVGGELSPSGLGELEGAAGAGPAGAFPSLDAPDQAIEVNRRSMACCHGQACSRCRYQ
ncbi:MAG: hypothetical protein ACK55Z_14485, partial [bacterium]